jgi:hypothetical protein
MFAANEAKRQGGSRLLVLALAAALVLVALPAAARSQAASVPCPLGAVELSTLLGKQVQRVNLGDATGDPSAQCSFSASARTGSVRAFVSPQVFLTIAPGDVGDLRDLYAYYVKAGPKLATRPQAEPRPELGPGAFTLTSSSSPVSTAFFLVGKAGVGTLLVDLTDASAARRDLSTADKIFTLVRNRLR